MTVMFRVVGVFLVLFSIRYVLPLIGNVPQFDKLLIVNCIG